MENIPYTKPNQTELIKRLQSTTSEGVKMLDKKGINVFTRNSQGVIIFAMKPFRKKGEYFYSK